MIQKKVLVAGGAGFLGFHLCGALLKQGHIVVCVDDLSTGSKERVQILSSHVGFSYIQHDMTESLDLEIDEIFNFACPASPKHYQKDPLRTIRVNVLGSWNLLELARKYKAKIFQASTSEVYGDPLEHPQREGYYGNVNTFSRRACYDEGKRMAETLFFEYSRLYSLPIAVARIFNTYGPHMNADDGRVVPTFILQALQQKPLTLYGNGLQTRSFCYIDDLIQGILAFMHNSNNPGPMNLGNPEEITMQALAELILELTGSKSPIVYEPLPEGDPHLRQPEITLAKQEISWKPSVALKEGLIKTILFFKDKIS